MDHQKEFLMDLQEGMHDDPHVFTPDELKECRDDGECCQCGMCCVAFETNIPEEKPTSVDQEMGTIRKKSLHACPYLKDDGTGHFGCGIHDVKDHPELTTCTKWRGNGVRPKQIRGTEYEFLNNYDVMQNVYIGNLILKGGPTEIAIAENFAQRGALNLFKTSGWGGVWNREASRFVNQVLSPEWPLETLPVNLFKLIKLEDWARRCFEDEGMIGLITYLNLEDRQNPLVLEFYETYIMPLFIEQV